MSRLCDDLAPCDGVEASSRDDLRPWEHAALDVGTALGLATACLRRGADNLASDQPPSRQAGLLAAAAAELTAGRDLLETHRGTDPAGLTDDRSEWAPVVTSVPVTRALVNELARWSRQLSPFIAQLASLARSYAGPGETGQVLLRGLHAELSDASQWLQAAGTAVRPALEVDPLRPADTELLQAIPVAMVPPRQRPGTVPEPDAELCRGITISASRLRSALLRGKDWARWSPEFSSDGWQWMAQAAAVTSHLSELALRSLAGEASKHPSWPLDEAQLGAAADVVLGMRTAWQEVDHVWDTMMTEGRLSRTTATADAADLVLRIGRLTWNDPDWTPARSRCAPHKPPAVMVPDADAAKAVIAAVHQAVDAIAVVAQADGDAVVVASAAQRLYVLTRSLPGRTDVPYRFAPAPVAKRQALRKRYDVALQASCRAAEGLDELAIASGAPSRVLALARAAAMVQSNRRGSQSQRNDIPLDLLAADSLFRNARASTGQPGRVEQAIRDRGISDPIVLLRAAAIDNAATQLIAEAGNGTRAAASRNTSDKGGHTARREVQLAAQSFPQGGLATGRPTDQQTSRSANDLSISAHRFPGRVRQSRPGRSVTYSEVLHCSRTGIH